MKKIFVILFILLSICSCDSFRRLAGRPTSEEIQAKREVIAAHEAAERERQAGLERLRREKAAAMADSLAALDSIAAAGIELRGAQNISDAARAELDKKYYIIVGVYRSRSNLKKAVDMLEVCGFDAIPIQCSNGKCLVGACPCNRLADSYIFHQKLVKLPFCPKASWILDMAQ